MASVTGRFTTSKPESIDLDCYNTLPPTERFKATSWWRKKLKGRSGPINYSPRQSHIRQVPVPVLVESIHAVSAYIPIPASSA